MNLISIIIPVYNKKEYLSNCLESLKRQTYRNIEIILVDDGSTDGSNIICDEYADNCRNIHVFHKVNNGVSSARNFGIKKANGEFVLFIDADDEVMPNYVEKLYYTLIQKNVDIVICSIRENYYYENQVCRKLDRKLKLMQGNIMNDFNYLYFNDNFYMGANVLKIYRMNLIKKYDLRFREDLASGEDYAFNLSYYESEYTKLNTAESIGMSNEALFEATDALLSYIKGNREDISCVQEINGVEREVFDERETAHMVDVKALYQNARNVCFLLTALGIASLLFIFFVYKKGYVSLEKALLSLKDGFRQVTLAFVIVVSFLVFYALVDFNRFWTVFHEIFFTNDLWLLDPRVSVMINMFPEEFFFGMVMRIALGFIICYAAITFISCYGIRRYFKKANLIEKDN